MSGTNTGGLHIEVVGSHNGYGDYLRRCAEAGKPVGCVKAFFDGGSLMEAKSVSADTITIWRGRPADSDSDNPHPEQDWLWDPSLNAQYADEWMTALYDRWKLDRDVTDYLEIVNEPNGGSDPLQFENQNQFFIECMKWADARGFKIAIGSFSAGCPAEWQVEILALSFDYAARFGHIVALHDGSVDEDRPLFSQAIEDGTGCRYRMYNQVLDRLGLIRPRYAITEGYRPSGYRGMSPAGWADMQAYLEELARDGILGWCWFSLGDYDFGDGSVNVVGQLPKYTNMLVNTNFPDAEFPEPPPTSSVMLDIPFLSQNNPVSANHTSQDCGPACLAMLLNSLGQDVTVNDVFQATGAAPGQPVTFAQMAVAALAFGCTLEDRRGQSLDSLRALLQGGTAPILLVNAKYLNQPGKASPYLGAHYILPVGYLGSGVVVAHDPNNLPSTIQPTLDVAWSMCHEQGNPDYSLLVLHEGEPPIVTALKLGVGMGNLAIPAPAEVNAIHTARLDGVKVLSLADPDDNRAMVEILRQSLGDIHIMARLFFSPDYDNQTRFSPSQFVATVEGAARALYGQGVRDFEIHNEPNLSAEGCGWNWASGAEFANWLIEVMERLRAFLPEARFGFPGLSPGEVMAGIRQEAVWFWNQASLALSAADFICLHSYWYYPEDGWWGMSSTTGGMSWKLCPYPAGKRLVLSEFSNNNPDISYQTKGEQYVQYANLVQATGLVAEAYAFVLSWDQDLNHEVWVKNGVATDIPAVVGSRSN